MRQIPWLSQHLRASRPGQSMVEVAISLLVFLMIGFGLTEGGMLAWSNGTLQHAVEEGARVALRPSTASETAVKQAVCLAFYAETCDTAHPEADLTIVVRINGDSMCTTGTSYGATRTTGDQIRICATYTYQSLLGSLITGNSTMTLSRQAQTRAE